MAFGIAPAAHATERTRLTIYTALEPEQHAPFKQAIEAAVPEVEISWVWHQTGVLTDRILAEREHMQADMVLGLAATSLIAFEKLGLLLPYEPVGADRLRKPFRDPTAPYTWTGMDAYLGVICLNSDLAQRQRILTPTRWQHLLRSEWKGRLVLPSPVMTGTGYLLVSNWIQNMGEDAAWAFMDALDQNVVAYLATGSGPCEEVANGRHLAGLSYDMRAALLKEGGAPIQILVPADGVGWELEAFAIVAGSHHIDLAKRVADWAASRAANELYAQTFAIVAHPEVSNPPSTYPPHIEARMAKNDLSWMAENRTRVLAEWTRRYGAKAQPN
ncbi:extracellular solute-binding protein [Methylobacterium durans]|uniref:extracellular solute-binding protein n=1 Tax=Methylobacterium durans TaxID=2202825 RepID=UPI001F4167DC|nr:extracellular solute-binding protein [Methylobacterium durans]